MKRSFFSVRFSRRSRYFRNQTTIKSSTHRDTRVAMAAPRTPSSGKPQRP